MDISETIERAGKSFSSRRVFSDPIRHNGKTVILAARIGGGAGGGEGRHGEEKTEGIGGGLGYGFGARPAGAFIVEDERVRWKPAFDLNRIILGWQIVVGSALLFLGVQRLRLSKAAPRRRRRFLARFR